jgi:hypothetical protein
MTTTKRKLAALQDWEAFTVNVDKITRKKIADAYDVLRRDMYRYGSGNYARAKLDGMPRASGYGSASPHFDEYTRMLLRADKLIEDGLLTLQSGAAKVRAGLAEVEKLTTRVLVHPDGGKFRCAGFGAKHPPHWAADDDLTHCKDQLCKSCYNARSYARSKARAMTADSEAVA